ncbi:MAG TPA: GWxTD domain-containing protein [Bryobacteraceae bacterium]|nr:GWxTD domain-containing protein [Bryobacteraceae bacterium]
MTFLESWTQTALANTLGWTLFHSLWEGIAVAVILGVALTVIHSARLRYIAACVALFAILAAFATTFVLYMPKHGGSDATAVATLNAAPRTAAGDALAHSWRAADLMPWLAPFWCAGVIIFYLRHLAAWMAASRLKRRGVCCAPESWQNALNGLSARLRLHRKVTLFESSLAMVPVVIGHLRPVILLPLGLLTGLPASQVESILLHELAHIRRNDYLVNMLQRSIEGLMFYHPAVWWISSLIRAEREHCCDDMVVAANTDARDYAVALAALEEHRWAAAHEPAVAATGGNLVKRVRRLLGQAEGPSSALTPVVSAAVLILTGALTLAAWQTAPIPAQYRQWLDEDVVYIITPQERAAFINLVTDAQRDVFIQQFWLLRDPTPGTPKNEFKEEHYRRIAYANQHFAEPSVPAGWRTDRGRIYITSGPPDEIEAHPASGTNAAKEVWLYHYLEGIGRNVMVEFKDRSGSGNFRMTVDPHGKQG